MEVTEAMEAMEVIVIQKCVCKMDKKITFVGIFVILILIVILAGLVLQNDSIGEKENALENTTQLTDNNLPQTQPNQLKETIDENQFTISERDSSLCQAILNDDIKILENFYLNQSSELPREIINKFHIINSLYSKDSSELEFVKKDISENAYLTLKKLIGDEIDSAQYCTIFGENSEICLTLYFIDKSFDTSDDSYCRKLSASGDKDLCIGLVEKVC